MWDVSELSAGSSAWTCSGSRSRGECDGVEGVTPVDEIDVRRDAVPE